MSNFFNVLNPLPLTVSRAVGGKVWDDKGKSYLDWYMDNGVTPLGYRSRPSNYKRQVPHLPMMYGNELRDRAAALLCETTGMDAVHFSISGTDAVETAIKAARRYHWAKGRPNKNIIVSLPGQYHGRTGWALAASTSAQYHKDGFGPMANDFFMFASNDILEIEPSTGKRDVTRPIFVDDVAAVIMSPVLCSNNIRPYSLEQHRRIREWCNRHGALLIHDDVQCGGGRAGKPATWQRDDVGVRPDVICLGKGIGAGEPLSACLATQEVASCFSPGTHYYTAGGATLRSLQGMIELVEWLKANPDRPELVGRTVVDELVDHPAIVQAWNVGAMVAVLPRWEELGADNAKFSALARRHGLIAINFRPHNEIKLSPRLNAPLTELRHGARIIRRVLDDLSVGRCL